MPFHDLNVAYNTDHSDLAHTLSFHHELGYHVVCVAITVTGELPPSSKLIPISSLNIPPSLRVLTRMTLTISDTAQNHRLANLNANYEILALRPTTEKTFQLCCSSLECDLISIDLSQRLPFILKFTTVSSALQRGVRFEICYSPGITGSSDARRNLISGAASLIRATRGRGIIISSSARNALGVRAPLDVINLAQVWGLSQERGKEALCEEAGKVIKLAYIKRQSYRGVVEVIDSGGGGEVSRINKAKSMAAKTATSATPPSATTDNSTTRASDVAHSNGMKRKASTSTPNNSQPLTSLDGKPLSKAEKKRRAKKARLEGTSHADKEDDPSLPLATNGFPLKHESLLESKDHSRPLVPVIGPVTAKAAASTAKPSAVGKK